MIKIRDEIANYGLTYERNMYIIIHVYVSAQE